MRATAANPMNLAANSDGLHFGQLPAYYAAFLSNRTAQG
jgi:hypothetical protein